MDPQRIVADLGLQEGMKIADFGSGSGFFTIIMAKAAGESGTVTAVDIMESALETVRAKAAAEGVAIHTVRANLEVWGSSGLLNDSQDLVLMANILFQSPRKEEILKEAHRILKQGGRTVAISWKKGPGGFGPPEDLRTDEETMKSLFMAAGFDYQRPLDAGVFHYGLVFSKR